MLVMHSFLAFLLVLLQFDVKYCTLMNEWIYLQVEDQDLMNCQIKKLIVPVMVNCLNPLLQTVYFQDCFWIQFNLLLSTSSKVSIKASGDVGRCVWVGGANLKHFAYSLTSYSTGRDMIMYIKCQEKPVPKNISICFLSS